MNSIEVTHFSASYQDQPVLENITLTILENEIFSIIGPAGSGKTTFLRSLNRMNDLVSGFKVSGTISFLNTDIYDPKVDTSILRRNMGMVFALPISLPGSIYENLIFGPSLNGNTKNLKDRIEQTMKTAYLWDEVKDRLDMPAAALSGGQQQRLCLARTLMTEPKVLLLDEPCSGLDPISTAKIEEALQLIKKSITVVLVTNNVMQASRVGTRTAFFLQGKVIEVDDTEKLFVNPKNTLTQDYISGRFG